ncbi:MAG: hypothetical protein WAO35_07395 [Terriglobia bacterium]
MEGFSPAWFIAVAIGIILLAIDHTAPARKKKKIGNRLLGIGIAILLVGVVGLARDAYMKLHRKTGTVEILYGNKELDGAVIETGGRQDVFNGLVIPTFQIRSTKGVTLSAICLYLSEGDARWDGPWLPTPSDDSDFPTEFYWGPLVYISPQQTWNTSSFAAQRNKGEPWDNIVKARIKIYFGADAPATADFTLRNNS